MKNRLSHIVLLLVLLILPAEIFAQSSDKEPLYFQTYTIEDGLSDNWVNDNILQPFFTTKKGTQGTGLGLSITNDIVKAHGGRLDISSTKEVGSTFTVNL